MRAIMVTRHGDLDLGERKQPGDTDVPDGAVRVRVKYAGVGFADVMAVRGGYPLSPNPPFSPGYECLGQVEQVGRAPAAGPPPFAVGDRVVALLPRMGAYREWLDSDARFLAKVPSEVSDAVAGALPLNYLTAYALIDRCAQLASGQSFLIHGGAGGVGTAALELARLLGLRAFATASPSTHDVIRALGTTPLNRHDGTWLRELKQLQTQNVDTAFNSFNATSFTHS